MAEEKLVRDKISEFSAEKKDGRKFRQASLEEKLYFLGEKIIEEAFEVKLAMYQSTTEHITEELGDVLEVIDAICSWRGITV